MDKSENLARLREERAKLEAALAGLSPEQMERPGVCGAWSVKDLLAHVASWERHLLSDLEKMRRGEPLLEVGGDGTFNQINEDNYLRSRDWSLEEVRAESESSYSQVIQWLEGASQAELDRPYLYGMTLGDFVKVDTWEHYAEHRAQIERFFG